MPTIEERVAFMEGQMSELSHGLIDLRDVVRHLEQAVRHLDQKVDTRFAQVDARFAQVDARFAQVDSRFDLMDRRFAALDDKVSRQFMWVVGVQVTTLVAIVGALLART